MSYFISGHIFLVKNNWNKIKLYKKIKEICLKHGLFLLLDNEFNSNKDILNVLREQRLTLVQSVSFIIIEKDGEFSSDSIIRPNYFPDIEKIGKKILSTLSVLELIFKDWLEQDFCYGIKCFISEGYSNEFKEIETAADLLSNKIFKEYNFNADEWSTSLAITIKKAQDNLDTRSISSS